MGLHFNIVLKKSHLVAVRYVPRTYPTLFFSTSLRLSCTTVLHVVVPFFLCDWQYICAIRTCVMCERGSSRVGQCMHVPASVHLCVCSSGYVRLRLGTHMHAHAHLVSWTRPSHNCNDSEVSMH